METPEARVAIVAAVRPDKGETEPDALDKAAPGRPAHGTAGADRAFANFLGECEFHEVEGSPKALLKL
jgi:hypothetical protein